jgi:hypothetical protein
VVVRVPHDRARPAVVVRSDLLSELTYAIVLPIATGLRAGISMRIDVQPAMENGLRAPSQVMVDWLPKCGSADPSDRRDSAEGIPPPFMIALSTMKAPAFRPTVVIPDAAPLIHLAAGDALTVLNGVGRVVLPDIVQLEATYFLDKPYAREIAAWIEAGQQPGSNRPVEVAETEIGGLYRIALDQGLRRPRNAGEIGIATWLAENLAHIGGPALIVYGNGRVPNILSREEVAAVVAVATTRNMLRIAQQGRATCSA